MIPLSQEMFEDLLTGKIATTESKAVIYFTATWCGPCSRVPLAEVIAACPGCTWYLCDVDENDYTFGYCGGRSIPAWLTVSRRQPSSLFQSSDGAKIIEWIRGQK